MSHHSGLGIEKAHEKLVDQFWVFFFKPPASIFLELYRNVPVNVFLEIIYFLEILYLQYFPRSTFRLF